MNVEPQIRDPLDAQVRRAVRALQHAGRSRRRQRSRVVSGEAGREQRGTRVRFMLRSAASPRVLEVRYRAYGCPHTLAACEWLAARAGERGPSCLDRRPGGLGAARWGSRRPDLGGFWWSRTH